MQTPQSQSVFLLFPVNVRTAFSKSLSERSWDPKESMQTEEEKRTYKQTAHSPECIEQIGVFITVMMCCMSEVTGKFPV